MSKKVAIIGAGIGGLATAARLAKQGFSVEVYEKLPRCGGRVHLIEDKGFKFDTGPSFVLMKDFFDELFTYCGEDIADFINLQVLDQSYKIFYPDGESINFYRQIERTKAELERIEPGSAKAFMGFLEETGRYYQEVHPLLYQSFSASSVFNVKLWPLGFKLNPLKTVWQLARKYFHNEKLLYAMTFQAMFIGVSPFEAPAFYSIITYADHMQKIYHPVGGMYEIAKAVERLCLKFDVKFNYDTEITRIQAQKNNVKLCFDHSVANADFAVINTDYAYAQHQLLKRTRKPPGHQSCSTFLMYLGMKGRIKGLEHHNVFFAKDLKHNLKWIFDKTDELPDISFYIYIPTTTDDTLSPKGKDIVYILVPVPNLSQIVYEKSYFQEKIRETVFNRINEIIKTDIRKMIEVEHGFFPQDFIQNYNLPYGSAFGLAHTLLQSAFFRPPNQDRRHKNLFYVGASTQPGGGLPPVIAGSRIVADMLCKE